MRFCNRFWELFQFTRSERSATQFPACKIRDSAKFQFTRSERSATNGRGFRYIG